MVDKISDKLDGEAVSGVTGNALIEVAHFDVSLYTRWAVRIENIGVNSIKWQIKEKYISLTALSAETEILAGGKDGYTNIGTGGQMTIMSAFEIFTKSTVANLHSKYKLDFLGWKG